MFKVTSKRQIVKKLGSILEPLFTKVILKRDRYINCRFQLLGWLTHLHHLLKTYIFSISAALFTSMVFGSDMIELD